ncbi:MAG TPA: glycosyltransferase family 39 protein [Ktedonobacterales bacterium]|nr:glycosyltransferase family 39 protein [Ktedonobacterales bacterium]
MEPDLPFLLRSWLRRAIGGWRWSAAWPGLFVTLVALGLRLALVLRYPLLYDIDAYGRWTSRDHPFSAPWVPLFQVALYLLTRVADSIVAVRLLSAFFGATAALAFWLLLRRAFGAPVAYLGALLLAVNPLFVTFSIVPYQEGLFFTLAFLALWLALEPDKTHWFWLTLVLALSGLARYEGWLLALFIWLLFLWRRWRARAFTWRFAFGSALALAWAPLLWIAVNRNVSPTGIQTLEPTLDPASLLATLGVEWPAWQLDLSLAGGMLALGGLLWLGWQARRGSELAWLLLAFLLGDVLVLAFLRPFTPDDLRLPLLALPVVIAGVSGLLVAGARFLWRAVWRGMRSARQPALATAVVGLATVALLSWYVPLATERVAAYDAVVQPSYLAADDLGPFAHNATLVVVGGDTAYYAFVFYAQQDGWHGQAIQLAAVPATPANLDEVLRVSEANLLITYAPPSASAPIMALAQQGILALDAYGSGYAIWEVQYGLPSSA